MSDQASVRLQRGPSFVDGAKDFPGDGHRDVVLLGELHDDTAGFDALGDHMHFVDDVSDFSTSAKLDAHVSISTSVTHAGGQEVAHSR